MFPTLVLLAGGSSSRFAPLTEKNLFKFLGKSLVEYQLSKFRKFGFEKMIVICNDENFDVITGEVDALGLDVKVLKQIGEGQAGAVTTALGNLEGPGSLLIVNMNDIFDDGLFEKFQQFVENNNSNALVGFKVDKYFPGGYLVLEGDNVVKVIEKPGEGNEPSDYVRIVFDYFVDSEKLRQTIEGVSSDRDDVYEVALSTMMASNQSFAMIEYDGVWNTIKYPWHVLDMMNYFLGTIDKPSISPNAQIASSATISGNVIIEEGVKVFGNAVVKGPAYIGKNTIIANNALVRDSIIGDNCVVGFATEIARSYISDSCWFHTNYVGDSILGSNISMGSGAVTANLRLDEQEISVYVKGEKINTGKTKLGNIVGNNVRIGINVSLSPGIKIGSGSMIGSNVLLTKDVENNKFVYVEQELEIKDNRFDITETSRDEIKRKISE